MKIDRDHDWGPEEGSEDPTAASSSRELRAGAARRRSCAKHGPRLGVLVVRSSLAVLLGTGVLDGAGAARSSSARGTAAAPAHRRGIPVNAPWVSFYGSARQMVDLGKVAGRFRLINIDADPGTGNFTPADIATLRAGGRNTVVSYLDVGACERERTYWRRAPSGFVPCGANRAAQIGPYGRYPEEFWMNPANPDYRRLIVDHVATRLAATGVDGFFLDNLELVEHGPHDREAPCDTKCVQGALMLVAELRNKFPDLVIVMQNATSATTRKAKVGGVPFPSLLDGISREETYTPRYDREAESELLAWKALGLTIEGRPFSITTEDYVGSCRNAASARRAYEKSRGRGFSPYATISSANQDSVCSWTF
jgi:cysteinyl-tRNA synthetase, unknown class